MKQVRVGLSIMLCGLMLVGMLGACQRAPLEVRIGLLPILSGNEKYVQLSGEPTVDGAELALRQLEAAGGLQIGGRPIKFVLVTEDAGDTAESAVGATKKLINQENVAGIVGPQFSSSAIPAAQAAKQSHIPLISPMSTNPDTTADNPYAFRVGFVDAFQGQATSQRSSLCWARC